MIVSGRAKCFFFFQAEDGIRDIGVTGVQTCALPISHAGQHRGGQLGEVAEGRGAQEEVAVGGGGGRRRLGFQLRLRDPPALRSEERRGGEEWRPRWSPYH